MIRQRANQVQQQQQRRKWSDWSECSSGCVKTRHRLNCDDLINAESTLVTTQQSGDIAVESSTSKTIANQLIKRQVVDDEEAQLLRGSHPSASSSGIDEEDYADEGDDDEAKDSCANVDPRKTFQEESCLGGRCRPQLSSELQLQQHQSTSPDLRFKLLANQRGRFARPSSQQQQQKKADDTTTNVGRADIKQSLRGNGSTSLVNSRQQLDSSSSNGGSAIWSPQHLLNGDLGPQASIVQWSILIGSLLTIILLIMLILRKLFAKTLPSYHWMLAKQTLKTTGKLDSCCGHRTNSSLGANQLLSDTARQLPPHHMYFAGWRNGNSIDNGCVASADQASGHNYQFVVDASGKQHLLFDANQTHSLTFNTDLNHHQHHQNHLTNRSSASSSGKSCQQHSILCTYDTLTGDTANYPTGALQTSANEQLQPAKAAAAAVSLAGAANKHSSPNVPPLSQTGNLVSIASTTEVVHHHHSQPQTALCRSISESSCSVQSTTAQMLSNAASSSFEQPPDLPGDFSPPVAVSANNGSTIIATSTCHSVTASPVASNQFSPLPSTKLNKLNGKLNNLPTTVQSQPNSPMFANQFSASNNRSSRGQVRLPKLTSRRNPNLSKSSTTSTDRSKTNIQVAQLENDGQNDDQMQPATNTNVRSQCDTTAAAAADTERHFYEEINLHNS